MLQLADLFMLTLLSMDWHSLLATNPGTSNSPGPESNAPTFGVFTDYLNLGVIVVVLGLAYTRKVRFEGEVKEKDAEIKELKQSLEKYIEHYQQEVLPALIEVTKVSGEVVSFLNRRRD